MIATRSVMDVDSDRLMRSLGDVIDQRYDRGPSSTAMLLVGASAFLGIATVNTPSLGSAWI